MIHDLANSATLIVAVILVAAGVMKRSSGARGSSETALGSLVRSESLTRAVWIAVAGVETSAAALLLLQRSPRVPLAGAISLFVAGGGYLIWVMLRQPDRPCGCFGADRTAAVSTRDV